MKLDSQCLRRRDVFLKIEPLAAYSPFAPVTCSRLYGRDCMFNTGHEFGRISPTEIFGASLDALVYREYLDPNFAVPNTAKLIQADVNEPRWDRRIPGSVLYAKPGERLYIHLLNGDPKDCHSLHVHGVRYGIDSDGAWPFGVGSRGGARSDELRPGERWTYVFDVTDDRIGPWAFHDHSHRVQKNVNLGLFGALIVLDPLQPATDHRIPLFIHQLEGAAGGYHFQSPTLAPGAVYSQTFPTPGNCPYHCLIHGPSMAGQVQVITGAAAAADVYMVGPAGQQNVFNPQLTQVRPGGTVNWHNNGDRDHIVFAPGSGAATYCLNGRAYVGNTPTICAESGERLRWFLFNLDLGGVWHNFHPHSASWRLPAPPGGAADVHGLSPVEAFTVDTVAPPALTLPCELEELQCNPPADACLATLAGDFLFHCHIEEHMMAGLAGLVRSRDKVWVTDKLLRELNITLPFDGGCKDECPSVDVARCTPAAEDPRPQQMKMQPAEAAVRLGMGSTAMGGMGAGGGSAGPITMPVVDISKAAEEGIWELLPCDSQVLAVHSALLHTGKVLFFAGSGNDTAKNIAHDYRTAVWDYQNGTLYRPPTPIDLFCSGQTVLPDGRVLAAGGTLVYPPSGFIGLQDTYIFDPLTEQWTRVADMATARWYPGLVSLGDGRVLIAGGTGDRAHMVEIFSLLSGWTALDSDQWPAYPNLVVTETGQVFYTGTHIGIDSFAPFVFDIAANSKSAVAGLRHLTSRSQAPSVLMPPAQAQRVMALGGGGPADTSIADVDLVDLSVPAPVYSPGPPMLHARTMHQAIILPDRKVFVCGGGAKGEKVSAAVLDSEIYDPLTNSWRPGARATVPRLYHSAALLLPDGRVVTAGSNPAGGGDDELRLELYHPPYLFKGPRPFIESVSATDLKYGQVFEIDTPQAQEIEWVQLVRPVATTHSCENSQRLVDIPFERHGCRLRAHIPPNANLTPPGWYMLFLTDRRRIPSCATWVHITLGTAAAFAEEIDRSQVIWERPRDWKTIMGDMRPMAPKRRARSQATRKRPRVSKPRSRPST